MINIFGNNRSVGPPGPRGRNAFDLVRWANIAAVRMYRESELINFYFNTKTDGIIFDKKQPVGLNNRGTGQNAKFIGKDFPKVLEIKHGFYMLELKHSIFKIESVRTATTSPSSVIIALTFKSLSFLKEPRTLFSNENGTRAIEHRDKMIKDRRIGILTIYSSGTKKEIFFDSTDWTALFIQYTCIKGVVNCDYILNERYGSLESGEEDKKEDYALYIGGHPRKLHPKDAHHAMGSFEMYYADFEDGNYTLSEEFKTCIIKDISKRVEEEEEKDN